MAGFSAKTSASDGRGLAIGGLVCGIVGVFFGSLILGPVALILGLVAHRKAASGMAKAAIVLGVVDIVVAIVAIAVLSSSGFTW
ncbi:DUF4190 domain-containing protein [Streptomyces sp. RKND-216]|uniref:DUF4190 domain-containing protein n=1 Tax=Streptomyces sp. RKND-216 TaxID=2562581 RepID=UPI00109D9072|nr:DUF4190 domain-containing protein [Streptomyces sp. RKND-216]THA26691.1 DUF4190 domain-containing protein [Streptomyces sp. RKND-216]